MSPKITSTALAAILVLGAAPLMAQTATETPAPAADAAPAAPAAAPAAPAEAPVAATAETPAAPAAAPAAPAAAPATGEPQVGAYYVEQSFDSWQLR